MVNLLVLISLEKNFMKSKMMPILDQSHWMHKARILVNSSNGLIFFIQLMESK